MSKAVDRELSSVLQDLVSGLVPQFMIKNDQAVNHDIELTGVWAVDTSWSMQAEELQHEILCQKKPLSEEHVIENLRNLRAIDKQITSIDRGMLQYLELKELVLTGNAISEVQNLPPTLSVLELSLNKLSTLDSLDCSPPSTLTHVGLSYNHITTLSLTPSKWPKLLSLDISFNGINDMVRAVLVLQQLPSLRSLMLCGNPAALCQGYPGYVVHTLKELLYIDGNEISAETRNNECIWQQNNDILTTSLITITASYSINTSDKALTPAELQEGERSMTIMWYQCSGLPTEYHIAPAVASLEDNTIPTDVHQRVLDGLDEKVLVLGPTIVHVTATGSEENKGSTNKAIVVRELAMLKEAIGRGCKVQPMLGYAVLREADKEVTLQQQTSNTQKSRPTSRAAASPAANKQLKQPSRGASPAKSPAGKKDKKGAGKGKVQQESLEGWKIVQFSAVSLDLIDCELASILHGASNVTSMRTSCIMTDNLTKLGLSNTNEDSTSDVTITSEVNVHVQHH